MMKYVKLLCMLLALILLGTLCAGCHQTKTPDNPVHPDNPDEPDKPDEPDTPDQPDQPDKPDKPEDPKEQPNYTYPDGEYEKKIELFGSRADNFAEGGRTLIGMTSYIFDEISGKYIQKRAEMAITGPRTYASVDRAYSPAMHINVDAYCVPSSFAKSYKNAGYEYIAHDGSFNKTEYSNTHKDVLQVKADGSTDGLWGSSVLTKAVVDYNSRTILGPDYRTATWYIGFSEPEMFRTGLYGKAYQSLWQMKYGVDFWDPTEDVEGTMMAQRLNVWTHTNAIKVYVSYLCGKKADFTNFSIAPHSTLAYAKLGVTDGYVHMMGTGLVKTVTGQTWSNTMENSFTYAGKSVKDPFINGLLDYGTYIDAADYYGADLYALCDPMSDTASTTGTEEYWRELCHEQLVASMMYPEINRWQLIWTNRSFMNVSSDYRSEQLNIHNALLDISGKEFSLTAGTPGITYLLSDTLTWQDDAKGAWGENAYDGFWGVAAPLLYDGIPLRTRAMELITGPEDLDGVTLLIVSYDNQKPLYEEVNTAIADWVKAGGTLLYLGGSDIYETVEGAFWQGENGGSPVGNLLNHLGLDITAQVVTQRGTLAWADDANATLAEGFRASSLTVGADNFTYCYTGSGFTPVLKTSAGDVVGIRAQVGEGSIVMAGISTAKYAESESGATLLRALTKLALQDTDVSYVTSDAYIVQRGNYTAIYPLQADVTMKGTYVNIFSSGLDILTNPVIKKGTAALLLRVDTDVSKPTVLSAGGFVDAIDEGEKETTITLHAAENAAVPVRIVAPAGLYPLSVQVAFGENVSDTSTVWDDATHSLLVYVYSTPTAPATVMVSWGEEPGQLKQYHYESQSIKVCKGGEDEAYIVSNSGDATGDSRYTDRAAEIVWMFDVSAYDGLQLSVSIRSNYILEVSGDGETWIKVADYSQLSTERATADNNTVINILTDAYPDVKGEIFIRLRNTDTEGGWGGAISMFTFRYLVEDK